MSDNVDRSVPEYLEAAYADLSAIVGAYLYELMLITLSTRRDPQFSLNHLLLPLHQDLVESAMAIKSLAKDGMKSAVKREIRFLTEASIKMCFVQQRSRNTSIQEKVDKFENELSSPRLSLRDIDLYFFDDETKRSFIEYAGRLYGQSSSFVHWTGSQIMRRIDEIGNGNTVGRESEEHFRENNDLVRRSFVVSLVCVCHAVGPSAVGDIFVEPDGTTRDSYYFGSRYLAAIDAYFDYKAERQDTLEKIREDRSQKITFV